MNAFWKTTRKTLTAFVLALVAGVTSMQAMAEQTFNWRFSNLYSRGTAYAEVYENFARNIETMSNGRIRIQVLYAGEGVGQTGVLGAVKSGLVQMGAIFQPAHSGEIPFGVVEIGLPGNHGRRHQAERAVPRTGLAAHPRTGLQPAGRRVDRNLLSARRLCPHQQAHPLHR